MSKKVDLGFGKRTKQTSSSAKEISREKNLVDGLVPENAPVPKKAPQRTKYVNFDEIYINEINDGLSMDEIDQLAESIFQVGLQQPLLVIQDERGLYRLISGHRRYRAIERLINQDRWIGKIEVKEADLEDLDVDLSDQTKELYLLLSGNFNREKTANDRFFEMRGWQKVYDELKKNKVESFTGLDGVEYELKKARDYISKMTGMSSGDLARLKKIENNATWEVIEALNEGEISVNSASEIASLDKEEQKERMKRKSVQSDTIGNLSLKLFNNDTKIIRSKIKTGVMLSDEDLEHYKECINELQKIIEKY